MTQKEFKNLKVGDYVAYNLIKVYSTLNELDLYKVKEICRTTEKITILNSDGRIFAYPRVVLEHVKGKELKRFIRGMKSSSWEGGTLVQ